MSVSSIFAPSSTDSTLSQLFAPASTSPTAALPIAAASGASTSTSVSSQAKLLKELQDLQQNNPAEFKQVTADIATQLQATAQQDGGSQGQALSALASKFQQASQTGSLSPLQGGHHHGGHHHHAASASDSSASSASSTSSLTAPASATSRAAAAYQQSGGSGLGSQVSSIIGQVLTKDLGSAGTVSATG